MLIGLYSHRSILYFGTDLLQQSSACASLVVARFVDSTRASFAALVSMS